jgi:glutathione S-transferase
MCPSSERVLWGIGTPRTLRVHWALCELHLPYETRPIATRSAETMEPKFTALNPRRKIPVLQDGRCVIAESAAIVNYLAGHYAHAGSRLVPRGRCAHAQWTEWCFFVMTELDATSLYVIRRHRALQHIYGEAPAAVASAEAYFMKQLAHVDQVFSSGASYLLGQHFTTADILLTTCLVWAAALRIRIYESCLAYLQRTTDRDAFRPACAANCSDKYLGSQSIIAC